MATSATVLHPAPQEKIVPATLKAFQDPIRIPPVLRPEPSKDKEGLYRAQIRMRAARHRFHSELPETDVWAYEGCVPGPTIEVKANQRVQVEWINEIGTALPFTAVRVDKPGDGEPPSHNFPGYDHKFKPVAGTEGLEAWNVVHLHGGKTRPDSDGWTENAILKGQSLTCAYTNNQRPALLWYHDHAMAVTRLTVYSGLAGLYIIRDDRDDDVNEERGLPGGKYEIPLLIQDRNLDLNPEGTFSGRLLHKTDQGTWEFFGPYTLVNGTIWPYAEVEPCQYRFRIVNGSNARTYRFHLVDDGVTAPRPSNGDTGPAPIVNSCIGQIGTDGGLLPKAVSLPPGGLTLAPAERADLVVDFSQLRGHYLRLVNVGEAPFDNVPFSAATAGEANPDCRLPYPDVMQFRVGQHTKRKIKPLRNPLSDCVRLTHATLPKHQHRMIALVEVKDDKAETDMLTLHELDDKAVSKTDIGKPGVVELKDGKGVSTCWRSVAERFEDKVNFLVNAEGWELWKIVNLTDDTHPFHVHLVQFQIMARDAYEKGSFEPTTCSTQPGQPILCDPSKQLTIDDNECGWKDVIRVNPGEMVTIAAQFTGFTGRYMYHCHVLEHEDMEMMRPFVVMPRPIIEMMMNMGGMPGM